MTFGTTMSFYLPQHYVYIKYVILYFLTIVQESEVTKNIFFFSCHYLTLSTDPDSIEPFRKKLKQLIDDTDLMPYQLYSADETGL